MNLPNFISLGRLFVAPLAVWLVLRGRLDLAFWLFVAAGVSDGVDGYLARRLDARTTLGRYLDPIADKVLLVSVFLTLGYVGKIDQWLVILVVSRDIMIVGGLMLAVLVSHPIDVEPSLSSKANTAMQIVFVALLLAPHGFAAPALVPPAVVDVAKYFVALTTIWSGAGYVATWIRHVGAADGQDRPGGRGSGRGSGPAARE